MQLAYFFVGQDASDRTRQGKEQVARRWDQWLAAGRPADTRPRHRDWRLHNNVDHPSAEADPNYTIEMATQLMREEFANSQGKKRLRLPPRALTAGGPRPRSRESSGRGRRSAHVRQRQGSGEDAPWQRPRSVSFADERDQAAAEVQRTTAPKRCARRPQTPAGPSLRPRTPSNPPAYPPNVQRPRTSQGTPRGREPRSPAPRYPPPDPELVRLWARSSSEEYSYDYSEEYSDEEPAGTRRHRYSSPRAQRPAA